VSNLSSKLVLYTIGVVGPAMLFLIYLLMCVWQIDSPLIGESLPVSIDPTKLQSDLDQKQLPAILRNEVAPRSGHSAQPVTVVRKSKFWLICDAGRSFLISLDGRHVYTMDTTRLPGDCADPAIKFHITPDDRVVVRPFQADIYDRGGAVIYLVGALLLLLNWLFTNINLTSAHGFYRDRLSKAYLFTADDDGIHANDGIKLSELNRAHSVAPYHLINAALNLQGSKDENLRGRNADFFLFSKHYSGSHRTGYIATPSLEDLDSHLNLGSACAISGAAAAPNMGSSTVKALVPLLTLLNIRLGYWLPNPRSIPGASWMTRRLFRRGAGPGYLWREDTLPQFH
jgi:hypothetical protein